MYNHLSWPRCQIQTLTTESVFLTAMLFCNSWLAMAGSTFNHYESNFKKCISHHSDLKKNTKFERKKNVLHQEIQCPHFYVGNSLRLYCTLLTTIFPIASLNKDFKLNCTEYQIWGRAVTQIP